MIDIRPLYRCRETGSVYRLANAYTLPTFSVVGLPEPQQVDELEQVDSAWPKRKILRITRRERCKRFEAVREVVSVSYVPCPDSFGVPETPPNSAAEEDGG